MSEPRGAGGDEGRAEGEGLPPRAPAYDLRTGQPLANGAPAAGGYPEDGDDLGIWAPEQQGEPAAPAGWQPPPGTPYYGRMEPGGWAPQGQQPTQVPYGGYPPAHYQQGNYQQGNYQQGNYQQGNPPTQPHGPTGPYPHVGPRTGLRVVFALCGVLVIAAAIALGAILFRGGKSAQNAGQTTPTASNGAGGTANSAGAPSGGSAGFSTNGTQAARTSFLNSVNGILTQSSAGRQQVSSVISGVQNGCTVTPESASSTIRSVIANRQSVLAQANSLTPPDAATATIKSELISALNASIEANHGYQIWLDNLYSTYYNTDPVGCPDGQAPTDSHYDAATAASGRATAAKQTLIEDYNPLASAAGLRTWSESEI